MIRGIDHIGLTVRDLVAAEQFLFDAFDAKLLFEVYGPPLPPLDVPPTEKPIASPRGARVIAIWMYKSRLIIRAWQYGASFA